MDAERRRPLNIAKDFVDALKPKKGTQAYDTTAQIVRIEDNTAWVHIPGGIDETPVKLTINATEGQTVQVRVADGTAFLVGNASAPPTDDRVANIATTVANTASDVAHTASNVANTAIEYASSAAQAASEAWDHAQDASDAASAAQGSANDALEAAQSAQTSATNANEYASRALGNLSTVQSVAETLTWITQHGTMTLTTDTAPDPTHVYFVRDNNGDYTVGSYKYSIVPEPDADDLSTYYVLSIDESLNNYVGTHLALTGEGLWLLPAASGGYKVLIATGAGSTYTTAGTYLIDNTGGVMAKFTASEITIGEILSGNYVSIDSDSFDIYHTNTQLAHFGYGLGAAQSGTTTAPYYTLGRRATSSTVGNYSVAEGRDVTASAYTSHAEGADSVASGLSSHAEGSNTTASGGSSHAEGSYTTASGDVSHAEGAATTASGGSSHAEGEETTASAWNAHAEGNYTTASGVSSHAEGFHTAANGYYSHAEGYFTEANGQSSHAQNIATIANGTDQTVIGRNNIADTTSAFIIGNGTSNDARSNALTVDWDGEIEVAGQHTVWHEGNLPLTVTGTTAIGTDNQSIPTGNSFTEKGSVTFNAGTYIFFVTLQFEANATGRRQALFSSTSGSNSAYAALMQDNRCAVNGAQTYLKFSTVWTFASQTTLYLNVSQNSGSSLTCTARYSAIKLK